MNANFLSSLSQARSTLPDRVQKQSRLQRTFMLFSLAVSGSCSPSVAEAAPLRAGVAKVDITNTNVTPFNGPLYAKALVLQSDATTAAIITVDAVAIGEIGPIGNDYLGK